MRIKKKKPNQIRIISIKLHLTTRERSSALPQHLGVVAIEKEAFGSLSTTVANFTYISLKSCCSFDPRS